MVNQITKRQESEIYYHKGHAKKHEHKKTDAVIFDCIDDKKRRYWNAYWCTYDIILKNNIAGKTVLVPGCGFGDDAIRLAKLGAKVYGFDISREIIDIAKERASYLGINNIEFSVFPSESTEYKDDFFDFVIFINILHHVDIPQTMDEIKRVMKSGGFMIGEEMYTSSFVQKYLRNNFLIEKLHPLMTRFIYGNNDPYITEFEHKIDEKQMLQVLSICSNVNLDYFNTFSGRIFPDRYKTLSKIDRIFTKLFGGSGKYIAGRVIFEAEINKPIKTK